MRILVVSGYNAWEKVSKELMPSHHLFGIHEMIDYYESIDGNLRGVLKPEISKNGYVDFYLWKNGVKNIIKQIWHLVKIQKNYDVIYDQLNRCSIFLGFIKKIGLFSTNLITILHHPPYNIQLKISDSDAYVFFDEDYLNLALKANPRKKTKCFVNEWAPDYEWYEKALNTYEAKENDAFYIDTGKSRRDRKLLIECANECKIRIDFAGDENQETGYARAYCVDLKDDIGMVHRIMNYHSVLIPVQENKKYKIGPLGITSYLDCLALRKPLIASDNVCFAKEITKNNIGILYKTGDKESFEEALEALFKNEERYMVLKNNISNYRPKTMKDYSDQLLRIIDSIFDRRRL